MQKQESAIRIGGGGLSSSKQVRSSFGDGESRHGEVRLFTRRRLRVAVYASPFTRRCLRVVVGFLDRDVDREIERNECAPDRRKLASNRSNRRKDKPRVIESDGDRAA